MLFRAAARAGAEAATGRRAVHSTLCMGYIHMLSMGSVAALSMGYIPWLYFEHMLRYFVRGRGS